MELRTIKCNAGIDIRTETLDGVEYLVAPCVMINQGVHNGSAGPLFYPADELKKTVEAWNHKPVLIEHPTKNGAAASSCDPDVLERQRVGFLMNSKFEDNKLKTEIWMNKKKAKKIAPKMLAAVENGGMLEVSTGLFTDDEKVENAEWNGEKYVARTMNYRPDHLAILPNSKGACSIADGAGFPRLNEENAEEGGVLSRIIKAVTNAFKGNPSHSEIRSRLEKALRDKLGVGVYITEVFASSVVYEPAELDALIGNPRTLMKAPYSIKDDVIEIGTGIPVEQRVDYVPLKDTVMNVQEATQNTGDEHMTKEEIINKIIENEQSPFGEDQRKVLNDFTEAQLAVVGATVIVNEEEVEKDDKDEDTEVKIENAETVLEKMTPELRDMFTSGLKLHKEKRATLVEKIIKCKTNKLNKTQLESMDTDTLESIAALVPEKADFSGQAPTGKKNAAAPSPLTIPKYNFEK